MKRRFTYKEFTLLVGILVAIVIVLTLWLRPISLESGDVSEEPAYSKSKPSAVILVVGKTYVLVKNLLQ